MEHLDCPSNHWVSYPQFIIQFCLLRYRYENCLQTIHSTWLTSCISYYIDLFFVLLDYIPELSILLLFSSHDFCLFSLAVILVFSHSHIIFCRYHLWFIDIFSDKTLQLKFSSKYLNKFCIARRNEYRSLGIEGLKTIFRYTNSYQCKKSIYGGIKNEIKNHLLSLENNLLLSVFQCLSTNSNIEKQTQLSP